MIFDGGKNSKDYIYNDMLIIFIALDVYVSCISIIHKLYVSIYMYIYMYKSARCIDKYIQSRSLFQCLVTERRWGPNQYLIQLTFSMLKGMGPRIYRRMARCELKNVKKSIVD